MQYNTIQHNTIQYNTIQLDLGVDPNKSTCVDLRRLEDLKSSGVGFTWRSRLEVEFRIEQWLYCKSTWNRLELTFM